MLVGGWGSINFAILLGTPYNVRSMGDIEILGCYVDNESIPVKMLFISI